MFAVVAGTGLFAGGQENTGPLLKLTPSFAELALSQATPNEAQAPVQGTQAADLQKKTGGAAQSPEASSSAQTSAQTEEKKISPKEAEELFRSVDEILKAVSAESGFLIKHAVMATAAPGIR